MKYLVDKATINVKAGKGGDGSASFLRAKYVPKGGPDGGDGGDGGSVFIVGDHNMATLLDFRSRPNYEAQNGGAGMKKQMFGKDGDDLYIKVPLGTLIYENKGDDSVLIGDVVEDGQRVLVAQGGRGGKGNVHFKSSRNQAPTKFIPGTVGEEKELILEVKMVADVGLIGMPSAGKSTLINQMTGTNAKVGSYPFTTLAPNLGRLTLKSGENVVVADIPGLIEGASEGKGLGDDFLRHIERTRVLVHVIDPMAVGTVLVENYDDPDVLAQNAIFSYKTIKKELEDYEISLGEKPEVVVINKVDVTEVAAAEKNIGAAFEKMGIDVLFMSAATGDGIEALLDKVMQVLEDAPERVVFEVAAKPIKIYTINNLPNRRVVQR